MAGAVQAAGVRPAGKPGKQTCSLLMWLSFIIQPSASVWRIYKKCTACYNVRELCAWTNANHRCALPAAAGLLAAAFAGFPLPGVFHVSRAGCVLARCASCWHIPWPRFACGIFSSRPYALLISPPCRLTAGTPCLCRAQLLIAPPASQRLARHTLPAVLFAGFSFRPLLPGDDFRHTCLGSPVNRILAEIPPRAVAKVIIPARLRHFSCQFACLQKYCNMPSPKARLAVNPPFPQ